MRDPVIVKTNFIYVLEGDRLLPVTDAGGFVRNTAVYATAVPRTRIGTTELLSDGPSAVANGVQKGADAAVSNLPSLSSIFARVSSTAASVGAFNDSINVGQHVLQGKGSEAATEVVGVIGQATGAWIGAEVGIAATSFHPAIVPFGAMVGGLAGAFLGASGAKSIGAYLTGGDTPDKLGPPQTLPANAALQPTITTAQGDRYALVQVDGKYTWFAMLDNAGASLPGSLVEVVSGARMAALTGDYLEAAGFTGQLAEHNTRIALERSQLLQEAFTRSEIHYANSVGPDGNAWGTAKPIASDATQTWSLSPQAGQVLNTIDVRNGDGSTTRVIQEIDKASGKVLAEKVYERAAGDGAGRLVATVDHASGVTWTMDRASGQMKQGMLPDHLARNLDPMAASEGQLPPGAALASYTAGNNAVTIQSGDTVDAIARRYGMDPQAYAEYLQWLDEDLRLRTRYYDGAGQRNDGSGETLAADYVRLAELAIRPTWAVQTMRAHPVAGRGMQYPSERMSLAQRRLRDAWLVNAAVNESTYRKAA